VFGALPSFQNHAHELDQAQRFLAYCQLHSELLREVRYPYLDRDLLEFVYAIPREQLVRVGERRSLMKRALAGIVPIDLLNRKRRAGIGLNRKREATAGWPTSAEMGPHLVSGSAGIIDPIRFSDALQRARNGEEICAPTLMRTIKLEFWLRHLSVQGLLVTRCPKQETHMLPVEDQELGSALQQKKFS
jgi:asparagine synthase (glutamine-hydrolysing)